MFTFIDGASGQKQSYEGNTVLAYRDDSNATLFIDALHNFTTVIPCHILNDDGTVTSSGTLGHCSHAWITPGEYVRDSCMTALGEQATPIQAYYAGVYNQSTVSELYEYQFGCTSLLSWPEKDLSRVYVEQPRILNTFMDSDCAYGSFIPSSSLKNWVNNARHISTQLQMTNAIDDLTRNFELHIVTRNANIYGLFYARLKMKFVLSLEGASSVHLETILSPMIDFSYGAVDHAWVRMYVNCSNNFN